MPSTPAPKEPGRIAEWLVDTGTTYHLCDPKSIRNFVARRDKVTGDKRIATAGGIKEMKWQVSTHVSALNLQVTGKAMSDCPPALSVGRLVLEQGCTFEWKPGSYPSLYLPCGRRVKLKVRRFVPALDALLIATAMAGSGSEGSEGGGDPTHEVTTDEP